MATSAVEERLRAAAFTYLRAIQLRTGGPVRYEDVATFESEVGRVALLDRQRGIRKPAAFDAALSFRTVHAPAPDRRPYDDQPGADGLLRYKWRGTERDHSENRAMRLALEMELPLIWFQGIASGLYLPVFPVWLVAEEPHEHQFVVALDLAQLHDWRTGTTMSEPELSREYAKRVVRERVHQPIFRARVLAAYGTQCAICRLALPQLLDAAHIKADGDGGQPVVPNGISLCKIHHAAFDSHLLGINPDLVVHIADRVRSQSDGPMLQHGLKEAHGTELVAPPARKSRPDRDLLAERFEQFTRSS